MKRYILILFLLLNVTWSIVTAQIPKNNLGKSLEQIRNEFPNLKYVNSQGNLTEYESNDISFSFRKDTLVAETFGIDNGVRFGYDWFTSLNKAFSATSFTRKTDLIDNGFNLSRMFYYPNFWITISFWKDDGYTVIVYQNADFFKN